MRSRILISLLFLISVISVRMQAQIYAPSANDSIMAFYGDDKVVVFNKPVFMAPMTAAVIAASTDRTDGWIFQWSRYSAADSMYIAIPGASTGSFSMLDTITVTSGYQVEIIKDPVRDTFRIWVVINDLDVKITNKDAADTLLFGYYDCTSLDLYADTTKFPTYYFNPLTHQKYDPGHNYLIRWTTDNDEATIPASRLLTRVSNPPWADTWYILTITDRFGLTRSDSVIYNSIQSKAEITSSNYISLTDTSAYPPREEWFEAFYDYQDGSKSAPALYKFDISGSKNLAGFELDFGDGDSVILAKDTLVLFHEYEKPGSYKVVLTTRSDPPFACVDSISVTAEVDYASETNFNMPNVFTPGKAENGVYMPGDLFRTTDVSVVYIDITIFTRTGLKVHEFEGNIRDWKGWDGTIMNSSREAPEGVYYYVIARFNSYQDRNDPISKKLLNGFIHLYRH